MADRGPLGWAITVCKSADDPYTCGCDSPLEADCDDVVIEVVPRCEYEKLREALEFVAHSHDNSPSAWTPAHARSCVEVARAALANTNEVKCTCAFEPGDSSSCEKHPEDIPVRAAEEEIAPTAVDDEERKLYDKILPKEGK